MQVGYKLATEAFGPKEITRQAVLAEQAGFDFVEMIDHYHPWLEAQGHSGFTWSMQAGPVESGRSRAVFTMCHVSSPEARMPEPGVHRDGQHHHADAHPEQHP